MQSRIFDSAALSSPRRFSSVPVVWGVEPYRNIVAGIIATVVSLPLSMGLGVLTLAPFGPDYTVFGMVAGLYSAAFLGLIAILAGARGVAIYAPRSLVSFSIASVSATLLIGADWLPKDDPAVVMSALFLMLAMAGVFQLIFAFARLPRLVKFIPTPVMAGFQNAAAITIILSQLHILLGWTQTPAMHDWLAIISETQFLQFILGFVTLALIFNGHRIIKSVPPILIGLIGGTLIFYLFSAAGLSADFGKALGKIPTRIPDGHEFGGIIAVTQLPGFLTALPAMVIAAASIAIVASLDVLISAKVVENLSGQRGNSTRELLCIGTANAITPLLGGIAGSISLGATTTNIRSGARNSLSLFTHGVVFLLIISFLAPLVGVIPKVVIAAIVIFVGSQLFDRWTFNLIKKIIKRQVIKWQNISVDFVVILLVTGVALTGQIVIAVGFGIIISVIVFTVRMSHGMVRSVRYGDKMHSRRSRASTDIEKLGSSGRCIMMIELEGPIFFASAEQLHNRIDTAIAQNVKYVVLDVARVTEVDSTGAQILVQTSQRMKALGVHMLISGQTEHSKTAVLLLDHGVADALTRERFFPDLDRALEWCENHLLIAIRSIVKFDGDHPFEQLDIVRGLETSEQEVLQSLLVRREYSGGSSVFEQGAAGDALYIILKGSASVNIQLPSGDRRLITFSSGTVFGEMAILDNERRSATVTADESLACYVLHRLTFEKLAVTNPRIALTIISNLAREMSLRIRLANKVHGEST